MHQVLPHEMRCLCLLWVFSDFLLLFHFFCLRINLWKKVSQNIKVIEDLSSPIFPQFRFFAYFCTDASDIDFFIGLPPEEEHTVSRISVAPCWYTIREMIYDPRILILFTVLFLGLPGSLMRKMWNNCKWFKISKVLPYNST